jgi:hypothetical protein
LQALEFLVELEAAGIDKTGYAFMTGGRMIGRSAGSAFDQPPPDMAELESAFVKVRGCSVFGMTVMWPMTLQTCGSTSSSWQLSHHDAAALLRLLPSLDWFECTAPTPAVL